MTTLAIQSDNAFWNASAPSSVTHSLAPAAASGGLLQAAVTTILGGLRQAFVATEAGSTQQIVVRGGNAPTQASATQGVVHHVEPRYAADDFDSLLAEFEADPETAQALSEGRRWVAESFYAQEPPTLTALRLAAGLSQRQLAVAVGQKQSNVSLYEAGKREPGIETAHTLAKALGVSLDAFYEAWKTARQLSHPGNCS